MVVPEMEKELVPCHVIAGPLGVGKTTAILDLVQSRSESERIAVIVNDFGRTGLDGEVLSAAGGRLRVKKIPGGCLCCSSRLDIQSAIEELMKCADFSRIIIEPSGLVILPDFIPYLKSLCTMFDLELRPVLSILNPARTRESHYKSLPFFSTLVDYADILVANRIDQCSDEQLEEFREWTSRLEPPKLQILETSFGHLPENVLESINTLEERSLRFYALPKHHTHGEQSGGFSGRVAPVDLERLRARLSAWAETGLAGAEIVRFKAILPTDQGWFLFEVAEGSSYAREFPQQDGVAKLDWISQGAISESKMLGELESLRAADSA